MNPRACHETELNYRPVEVSRKIAVVGAGPAGLAFSTVAAGRGHDVSLFEKASEIGGQFNMAKQVPGKEEFYETLRYYRNRLDETGVELRLNEAASTKSLQDFDEIVLASGVHPRIPDIPGISHDSCLSYLDVINHHAAVGKRVAIIGAGGIGFDVAEFLLHDHDKASSSQSVGAFTREWGIDASLQARGGVDGISPDAGRAAREIFLLQRKTTKAGKNLGKTTGWIHRMNLKKKGVVTMGGVSYRKIDDKGLHILHDGEEKLLEVDNVIICAGQVSNQDLLAELSAGKQVVHVIGGAFEARELDAKHAIKQGSELAAKI